MSARDIPLSAEEFDRRLFKLLVATADRSDPLIDRWVTEVLQLVRDHLQMDVVFVSQFESGRRMFMHVQQDESRPVIQIGQSDPLELTACKAVVDGRLPELMRDAAKLPPFAELVKEPFPIGAHLNTPIMLRDGTLYGTLCCFSFAPNEDLTGRDLKRLQIAAQMIARLIDRARERELDDNGTPA